MKACEFTVRKFFKKCELLVELYEHAPESPK